MQSNDLTSDIDQQIRINELREAARDAAGGEMTSWESDEIPPGLAEQFWQGVLDYENAEETCHFKQLTERGFAITPSDELDDDALTKTLWQLIDELAKLDVYLSNTDHLSDRELYVLLTEDVLLEITTDFPPGSGWCCHLDILGGCSEEDLYLYNKFYATEQDRIDWQHQYPEDTMPEHVDPPYDRDRLLPHPNDER